MEQTEQTEQTVAQLADKYVNPFAGTPEKMIVDLSALEEWAINTSLYDWFGLPDDEAYKTLPALHGKFNEDTVCYACKAMALFIELICPEIKDGTQRDYYKGLFYKGYVDGLNAFGHEYEIRCSDDLAPTLADKRAGLFVYYSELRAKYKNTIGFSADVIEKMGHNSALMLSAAHKLRLMDKYPTAIEIQRQTPPVTKVIHFSAGWSYEQSRRILEALQKGGFISSATTVEAFYYRMTGNGPAVSDRLNWIRKAKNKAINLAALVDFVVSAGVDLELALRQIGSVFCRERGGNINFPDSTKSNARDDNRGDRDLSADHQEITNIIDEVIARF